MEVSEMLDIIKRTAPWAKTMTPQETEFVVRRAIGMGLDPLNPAEVQIWKDDKGRVNFQIGYALIESWVKKVYGQHTQPRYTRLGAAELEAEGLDKTSIAYRCEFIMCSDLKAMADMAAIVGPDEALRMFTCTGIGVASQQEFNNPYFAPKGRSATWKVQKRALTDSYRQKFGVPTAQELAAVKQRLGYALPTAEDYEQAALTTSDPVALDTLAQARANDRALPAPTVTVEQAAALLYGDEQAAPPVPAPAPTPTSVGVSEAVTVETEIEAETGGEPAPAPAPATAPAPAPAPAHWIDNPKTRAAFWERATELGLTRQDVLAALGVMRVHDYSGTLEEAGAAIKRYLAAKGG